MQISTHAPRAGSDTGPSPCRLSESYFNPRSPCGERRVYRHYHYELGIFQPTLPVRGATPPTSAPRTPCQISTHAPRAGSDVARLDGVYRPAYFNPRSPCGERPQYIALIVFCCQYADQRRAIGPEKQAARTSKRPNAVRTSPVTLGSLMLAPQTTAPRSPRLHTSASRPRALSSFGTCCPDNRIASCPSQGR